MTNDKLFLMLLQVQIDVCKVKLSVASNSALIVGRLHVNLLEAELESLKQSKADFEYSIDANNY
jgi:hypothetical protein